jgi:hypothetical protein
MQKGRENVIFLLCAKRSTSFVFFYRIYSSEETYETPSRLFCPGNDGETYQVIHSMLWQGIVLKEEQQ